MHLFVVREIDASLLVTSDRVMAAGGEALGFTVVRFLERRS